jgi:hypothetical protein
VGLSFISRSNKALTGASSINTVCQKILNWGGKAFTMYSRTDGDFCHQGRDTEIPPQKNLRLSKHTDMTVHW